MLAIWGNHVFTNLDPSITCPFLQYASELFSYFLPLVVNIRKPWIEGCRTSVYSDKKLKTQNKGTHSERISEYDTYCTSG
jgi:hypothetical protein